MNPHDLTIDPDQKRAAQDRHGPGLHLLPALRHGHQTLRGLLGSEQALKPNELSTLKAPRTTAPKAARPRVTSAVWGSSALGLGLPQKREAAPLNPEPPWEPPMPKTCRGQQLR